MSKKAAGPKESQLRELREKASDENGLFDVDAYQNELQALREKHLTGVRNRITELQAKRREIDDELNKLNLIENNITGHAKRVATPSSTGRRKRMTAEEKLGLAEILYQKLTASKLNRFSSTELKEFSTGVQPRELVDIWNEAHTSDKSKQIRHEGDKAARRYFVG